MEVSQWDGRQDTTRAPMGQAKEVSMSMQMSMSPTVGILVVVAALTMCIFNGNGANPGKKILLVCFKAAGIYLGLLVSYVGEKVYEKKSVKKKPAIRKGKAGKRKNHDTK
jgi:hypothetical protein